MAPWTATGAAGVAARGASVSPGTAVLGLLRRLRKATPGGALSFGVQCRRELGGLYVPSDSTGVSGALAAEQAMLGEPRGLQDRAGPWELTVHLGRQMWTPSHSSQ